MIDSDPRRSAKMPSQAGARRGRVKPQQDLPRGSHPWWMPNSIRFSFNNLGISVNGGRNPDKSRDLPN